MADAVPERILEILKENTRGLTIEEVSRRLDLNRTTVAKYLNSFVTSGQADLREIGRSKLFSLSRRVPLNYVINLLSDLILVLDQDLIVVEANTALFDWFGLVPDALVKQQIRQTPLNSFMSEDIYRIIERALKGDCSTYEISLERNGTVYYFRARFIPMVYSNGQPGVGVILEDISKIKGYQIELEEHVQERTRELADANARLTRKIEEHRQTLAALRESEIKYRRIVETASEGIWIIDASLNIIYANVKFAEILGYSAAEELIGKNVTRFILPEDLPDHFLRIATRLRGDAEQYERRFLRSDGKICWVLVSAAPLFGPTGEFISSFAMLTDITAQKELEQKLEEKSRYYEHLLQVSSDAIHVVDPAGNLVEWNDAFLKHLGYSAAEVAVLNSRDWDVCSRGDDLNRLIHSHEFGKGFRFETRHRTKDGRIKDVEICATRTLINGKEVMFASVRDISQRKKTERALRARANWIRKIAETVGGLVWEMDENGLYMHCSPAIEKILGYAPEEIIGKMYYYDFFPAKEREQLKTSVERIMKSHKPFRSFQNIAVSKDGRVIHFESTGVPTFGPDGTFTGYRGLGLVIPAKKEKSPGKKKKITRPPLKKSKPVSE